MQSVALRLIAEREAEREAFKPDEWWTVDPLLTNANGKPFRVSVRNTCPSAAACEAMCMQHRCFLLSNLKMCFPITNIAIVGFCCKAGQKYSQARCIMHLYNGAPLTTDAAVVVSTVSQ